VDEASQAIMTDDRAGTLRLLDAWRGEVEANQVYLLLAEHAKDSRQAEILRRMAAAESGHRRRIEARLEELGVAIPDPSSVRISPWLRLQTRIAPLNKVLAAREAAEQEEIEDRYHRPTGDQATDELLSSLRKDEKSHSMAIHEMQLPDAPAGSASTPQGRLDRILGRERWHQSGSGWISGAIYGANDGLAAVFGIIAGVSAATGGSSFVLTAGLSGALASGISMATGAFLAERSEAEVGQANVARERQEIVDNPEEEKEELALFYMLKGMSEKDAYELAEKLSTQPDAMLQVLSVEELGGIKTEARPTQAALAAGVSTLVGAMVPVLPFFFLRGFPAIATAAVVSLIAHFLVGAAKSLVTLRTWWSAGLEMTAAGVIVGGVLYTLGLLFRVGG
jgi:VIT1/CCC1 family predicted Fe2+/Mn2+ transporter/rubrerythrin